ncbi:MAG TPA: AI-2E family transporter [Spirochaetota bacterium]|nr:AI-2E family transporter [Spirochaetota bacterium]
MKDEKINSKRKFVLFLSLLIVLAIFFLWEAVYPIIFGIIFFFIIDIFNRKLLKIGIKHNISIIITIMTFLVIIMFIIGLILPFILKQSYNILTNISDYAKKGQELIDSIVKVFKKIGFPVKKEMLINNISNSINSIVYSIFNSLIDYAAYSVRFIIDTIVIILTVYYFLKDRSNIKNFINENFSTIITEKEKKFITQIGIKLKSYIKSVAVISVVVMVFIILILIIYKIPYSIAIGVFSGIISIIPYVGPLIHIIFIAMIQLTNDYSVTSIVSVILLQLIFYTFIGFYLQPKILSSSLKIHPLIVIMSIIIGSYIYGIVGMIFAVPVAIFIQSLFEVYFKTYIKS